MAPKNLDHQETANPGIVRPPLVYLLSVILGFLINVIYPLKFELGAFGTPLAALVFAVGVALFLWTRNIFRTAKTPIPGNMPMNAIITSGPFKYSRNPMYVAFTLLALSIGLWHQSYWMLITLIGAILVVSAFVIPREERYMAKNFGAEFTSYKSNTRRWV